MTKNQKIIAGIAAAVLLITFVGIPMYKKHKASKVAAASSAPAAPTTPATPKA